MEKGKATLLEKKGKGKGKKPMSEKQLARQTLFKEAVVWTKEQLKDKALEAALRAKCKGNNSPNSLLIAKYLKEKKGKQM